MQRPAHGLDILKHGLSRNTDGVVIETHVQEGSCTGASWKGSSNSKTILHNSSFWWLQLCVA